MYSDGFYTNFWGLNIPENGVECKSFTVFFIVLLLTNNTCKYI